MTSAADNAIVCSQCGRENVPEAHFCATCGRNLAALGAPVTTPATPDPSNNAETVRRLFDSSATVAVPRTMQYEAPRTSLEAPRRDVGAVAPGVICNRCGHSNSATALFCEDC